MDVIPPRVQSVEILAGRRVLGAEHRADVTLDLLLVEAVVLGAHRLGDHTEGRKVQVHRLVPTSRGGQERERRPQSAVGILLVVRRQLPVIGGRARRRLHRKFLRLTRVLVTR